MTIKRSAILFFLATTATSVPLVSGCAVYVDGGGGGAVRCVGAGCPCASSSECPRSTYCSAVTLKCVAADSCTTTAQCRNGFVCDTARATCVPPQTCRFDGDCSAGSYCDTARGTCTTSSSCTTDSQCSAQTAGFVCDFRSTCTPARGCRTTTDCPSESFCIEGACRARAQVCQFDYQCGAGRQCVNNACVPLCTTDAQCGSGMRCVTGVCSASATCRTSAECSTGSHCVEGRCFASCQSTTCRNAQDTCTTEEICRPDWTPRAFCTRDDQCASGHVCRQNVCRTTCNTTQTGAECRMADAQLSVCEFVPAVSEYLCKAPGEVNPDCFSSRDCTNSRQCIDGHCQ